MTPLHRRLAALSAFALLALPVPAKEAAADPLAAEAAQMERDGYSLRQKVAARVGKARLAALLFAHSSGEFDRLKLYEVEKGKARLLYMELSSSKHIEFADLPAEGRFPDLYGDGSRTVAYFTVYGSGESRRRDLHLIRYAKGRILPEALPLPDGSLRDLDGDGRPEVVTRSRPLGQFFAVECDAFRSMAQAAFRTTVYEWEKGRLVPASPRYRKFFEAHIAELEGVLAGADPRRTQRYGDYLGSALSLYFDYAETGLPRNGWNRFSDLFQPAAGDPHAVASCIRSIKADIRGRLAIPDDW